MSDTNLQRKRKLSAVAPYSLTAEAERLPKKPKTESFVVKRNLSFTIPTDVKNVDEKTETPFAAFPRLKHAERKGNSSLFKAFTKTAEIQKLDPSKLPHPFRKASYNDDVILEHFQSSARHYAGKQRRGVTDEHLACLSRDDHIEQAIKSPFFLSLSTPLPKALADAARFVRDSDPELIALFWDDQLDRLDDLVRDSSQTHHDWLTCIPPQTRPAAGKIQLPALMALASQCGIGGSIWLQQFLFGFPLVGRLAQPRCFPPHPRELAKKTDPVSKALRSSSDRFEERACKSGFKNAKALWNEAMEQCDKGWLNRPFPLSQEASPYRLSNPELNIAFRFGVEQGEKLRACDDLRYSRTNLSCVVETPIKLVSWDHLAELSHMVNDHSRDWSFFKADHEAAYKQLPLEHSHAELAVIALRSPVDGMWYGFISRTMMFGAIAAVLHYNVFSRLLSEIVSKLLGIPLLCFFDDFGSIIPASLAEKALSTFTSFCSKLGIQLKEAKSEFGQRVTFLGLSGSFPCRANNFTLEVSLPPDKAAKWSNEVKLHMKAGMISSSELEKLIGKLGFSQTNLFGKFARAQLRLLYKKFYARSYRSKLSPEELKNLSWWAAVLSSLHPRIPRPSNCRPDLVVYTDAALLSRLLAAVVLSPTPSSFSASLLLVSSTPQAWMKKFNRKNPIIGMELLAPLALLWGFPKLLRGKRINLYVDNDTVSNALIRGDCSEAFLAAMVKTFWKLAEELSLDIWVGRVGSKVNPADLPTRHQKLPFKAKLSTHFTGLFALMCEVKKW